MVRGRVPLMDISRNRLLDRRRKRLNDGRNASKATVDLYEIEGRMIVVKDLSSRPWPIRALLGPWQLDREARAYRLLDGVSGVPGFLGRVDRQAIALEYIEGRNLGTIKPGEVAASFFDSLDLIIKAVHQRGVAHGDLHRHDVLTGPDGEPYLIDFSTAVTTTPGSGRLRRILFEQIRRADLRSAEKMRRRFHPEGAGPLPERPILYRIGFILRRGIDLLRRRTTRS